MLYEFSDLDILKTSEYTKIGQVSDWFIELILIEKIKIKILV
jgi:hypothetical protein